MSSNLTSGDALTCIAEDIALALVLAVGNRHIEEVPTAIKLMKPSTKTTIPEAITMRQKPSPSDCSLVAGLLRLPRTFKPSTTMAMPRVTKPCSGLRRGQLRAKKPRKSESSETRRNTAPVLAKIA